MLIDEDSGDGDNQLVVIMVELAVMVVVMMVLAVMVMVGNSKEQMEGKKGSCHQNRVCILRFICPQHAHIQEGAPLGQALQDTDVGGKIARTSVKYCVPDAGDCALDGYHSCDLIVDLQTLNSIPPRQASLMRCGLRREGVSSLER